MNDTVSAVLLGIVQGLTEFLPVSSSGHLVMLQQYLPVTGDALAFDLALHLGTLVPVLVVYGKDLWGIVRDALAGEGPYLQRTGIRLLLMLVVGSVPTAIIGLAFEDLFEQLFGNALGVAIAFAVTGVILFLTQYARKGDTWEGDMRWWQAGLVGLVQGIAITPGISRSGSTIAAGLFLGLRREYAARFSFLLSIPAIAGAFLLQATDIEPSAAAAVPMAAGFVAAALSGYVALRVLVHLVRSGDFSRFSWYLWAMAIVALVIALTSGPV